MSDTQLERLNTLLARVQENRRVRPAREVRDISREPTRVVPTAAAPPPSAAMSAEPARPRRPTPEFAPEPVASADAPIPAPPVPRKPAVPARPSPLEMAFAGELDREEPPAALQAEARREPAPRSQRPPPLHPVAPAPLAPEEIVPRVIEPDPPRPLARPIAQLVSKHAPPVDATFGAMLKRSLSLRPH